MQAWSADMTIVHNRTCIICGKVCLSVGELKWSVKRLHTVAPVPSASQHSCAKLSCFGQFRKLAARKFSSATLSMKQ